MCNFVPDDRKWPLQIKSAFESLMNRVKSFISGQSEKPSVAKSNDSELAIANSVGKIRLNV
jgi:hypothetical protein